VSITQNQVALSARQAVVSGTAGIFGMEYPQEISLSERELVWAVGGTRNPLENYLEIDSIRR
jgi:hypothetical protein